jgi:hypothetical protein
MAKLSCQSPFSALIQTFRALGGRPATGPCRRVGVPWQPYVGRGPTSQSAMLSKTPWARQLLSFLPPSSLSLLVEKTELPLPPPGPTCSWVLATASPPAKLRPSLRLKPRYLLILLAHQAEPW